MALDYRKCAEQIAANIGGGSNVISAAHCATRLRLVIADNSKVNKEVLENIDGVKGMFESNGQLQLIIGTGTVNKVYDEFLSVTGASAATKADDAAAAETPKPVEDAKADEAAAKVDEVAKPEEPPTLTYKVKEGDDLVSIAIAYGISPSALMDLNDLKATDEIKPGQILKLPANAKASAQ